MKSKIVKSVLATAISVALVQSASAEIHIRANQIGYSTDREKVVVVMSDKSLTQAIYTVSKNGQQVLSKTISSANIPGEAAGVVSDFSPFNSNHTIDLSSLTEAGNYQLEVKNGDETATTNIKVANGLYANELTQLLTHLKTARSGTSDTLNHEISHVNDSSTNVKQADGPVLQDKEGNDLESSQWKDLDSNYRIDVQGGWYDAGDYIKFTLTNAVTAYYLTRAYEVNPTIHKKSLSKTEYVDILDEAKHGLDYLVKLMPSAEHFINQVGSNEDHDFDDRLPENDTLRDFHRPAFSAKSVPSMALVAAALAHGSSVFKAFDADLSKTYIDKAEEIWAAANQDDVLDYVAFDRSWFYADASANDNLALAAVELYKATNDAKYLTAAKGITIGDHYAASWEDYALSANQRLANDYTTAKSKFTEELDNYFKFSNSVSSDKGGENNIWGVPTTIYWASLYNNLIVGAVAAEQAKSGNEKYIDLAYDNIDFLYGRNSWGTSFVNSTNVQDSADQIYHQMYRMSGNFPTGAVSEGPVERSSLLEAFEEGSIGGAYRAEMETIMENSAFDTKKYINVNHDRNYSNQETTIFGQASAIYLLSAVSALEPEVTETEEDKLLSFEDHWVKHQDWGNNCEVSYVNASNGDKNLQMSTNNTDQGCRIKATVPVESFIGADYERIKVTINVGVEVPSHTLYRGNLQIVGYHGTRSRYHHYWLGQFEIRQGYAQPIISDGLVHQQYEFILPSFYSELVQTEGLVLGLNLATRSNETFVLESFAISDADEEQNRVLDDELTAIAEANNVSLTEVKAGIKPYVDTGYVGSEYGIVSLDGSYYQIRQDVDYPMELVQMWAWSSAYKPGVEGDAGGAAGSNWRQCWRYLGKN